MQENYRSYKSKTLTQFKDLVNKIVSQDASLLELSDNSFGNKVDSAFTSANYFGCFYFIKNFLNIDSSSKLGKQYLKTIYTNLAVRIRTQKKANKSKDEQEKVIEFQDKVALLKDYDSVDISDFQQLSQTFREKKESKKRDFAATKLNYRSSGLPPKKQTQPITKSNVRTSDKEIDNNNELDIERDEDGNVIEFDDNGDPIYSQPLDQTGEPYQGYHQDEDNFLDNILQFDGTDDRYTLTPARPSRRGLVYKLDIRNYQLLTIGFVYNKTELEPDSEPNSKEQTETQETDINTYSFFNTSYTEGRY